MTSDLKRPQQKLPVGTRVKFSHNERNHYLRGEVIDHIYGEDPTDGEGQLPIHVIRPDYLPSGVGDVNDLLWYDLCTCAHLDGTVHCIEGEFSVE